MAKLLKSNGVTLYPVCGFQKSQHKLYFWENFYYLRREESSNMWEKWELWNGICEYATCIHNGLIYMPYKYYQTVKEAIVMYDIRH